MVCGTKFEDNKKFSKHFRLTISEDWSREKLWKATTLNNPKTFSKLIAFSLTLTSIMGLV